jgi:pyrroline-5-carboxylate reductase
LHRHFVVSRIAAVRTSCPTLHRCVSSSFPTESSIPTKERGSSPTSGSGGAVFDKISFIGTGMMAQAILEPLIKRNVQPADQITVYDVNDQMMDNVAGKFGVRTAQSLSELVHGADLVVCAVKPQNLTAGFFKEVRKGKPTDDAILLSIVAGKTMSEFERGGFSKIVRSMPNTPATIGKGMTVWSCSNNVSSVERRKVRDVLQTMGEQLYVDDESFIDMATSISGSGPAYIFMVRRECSRIWNVTLLVTRPSLTESPELAGFA